MNFLEKNLEDIIFETSNASMTFRGLRIKGKKMRQVRIGRYGIADMITVRRKKSFISEYGCEITHLEITVFELKRKVIDSTAMMQACRYMKGISEYILNHRKKNLHLEIKAVLVGESLSMGDFCYVPDFMSNLMVYTYKYDFDGIKFEEHSGYSLSHSGF